MSGIPQVEKIRIIAEGVMGWRWVEDPPRPGKMGRWGWYDTAGGGQQATPGWDPLHRDDHALRVVDKLLTSASPPSHVPLEFTLSFLPGVSEEVAWQAVFTNSARVMAAGVGATRPMAISEAVLEAVRMRPQPDGERERSR